MAKYRRATITTPAITKVVNFDFNTANKFDRRSADDAMTGIPVKMKEEGSGSFELCSGTFAPIYNGSLVAVVQDVAVSSAGVETITSRTFTFTAVTTNQGMNANNDGGEGSRKVSFDFGAVTET